MIRKLDMVSEELENKILADFDNSKMTLSMIAENNHTSLYIVQAIIKEHKRRRLRSSEEIHKEFLQGLEKDATNYWKGKIPPKDDFSRLIIPLLGANDYLSLVTTITNFKKYPILKKVCKSYFGGV